MSHLVASEEPANPINTEQLSRFRAFVKAMPARRLRSQLSGVFLGADIISTPATGAALYGSIPAQPRQPMRPVVTLHARVLQTRRVDALQTVGYGGAWRSGRATRVATIALGYADG